MEQSVLEKKKELTNQYSKWVDKYVSYIFFADPVSKQDSKIFDSASVTFIDTGQRKIAVTNEHVISEYRKLVKVHNDINFQLGSFSIDIESRLIDINKHCDLATFYIKPKEIESLNRQFCFTKSWTPKRIKEEELLIFAGYPGAFRDKIKYNYVHFDSAIYTEQIISVSDDSFKIALDRQSYKHFLGNRKNSELTDLSGFSGAGVFRINQNNPISYLEPVGIIFEGINEWQLQMGSHIDFIDKYGKIKI